MLLIYIIIIIIETFIHSQSTVLVLKNVLMKI